MPARTLAVCTGVRTRALDAAAAVALIVIAASLVMVALVTVQVAGTGLDAMSKAWQVATVFDFAVFAGATLVLSADGGQHGAATRRLGAACGFVVGGLF